MWQLDRLYFGLYSQTLTITEVNRVLAVLKFLSVINILGFQILKTRKLVFLKQGS